jgi:membrane-bound lytic murein transglycosylase B
VYFIGQKATLLCRANMIQLKFFFFVFAILTFLSLVPFSSSQARPGFEEWLSGFKVHAAQSGISQKTIQEGLSGLTPNSRIIELDQNQPNKKWTFAEYQNRVVDAARIQKGRKLYQQYRNELAAVEAKYGVPGEVIVALWGVESNFGQNMGGFDVLRSLATLAWEGRREKLFTEELIAALKIIDQGHTTPQAMKGSWAGAMGQSQFMPTSFLRFAQDGNGDGRRDIWGTKEDVFASAANYLKQSGWEAGYRWGRRVSVPKGLSSSYVDLKVEHSLSYWQSKGVRTASGHNLPQDDHVKASLVAPDGLDGPVFLVYNNYKVIMKWNRSTYFATTVGLLADVIAQ